MIKLTSLEDIQNKIVQIRYFKNGFVTNFFLNPFKHSLWIKKGEFFGIEKEKTVFLLRSTPLFTYLFYISTNYSFLNDSLSQLLKDYYCDNYVVDIVGNDDVSSIRDIFTSLGFEHYTTIHRMSRIGISDNTHFIQNENLHEATSSDAEIILYLLKSYFDEYSEQIPYIEEIHRWINLKQVIIYREKNQILGFIIYDLQGMTLYLKYWFVHPDFRDKKIGSILFNSFICKGWNSKRQLLWVIDSNENAIKRYKHYGFNIEKMCNYVLLKKR